MGQSLEAIKEQLNQVIDQEFDDQIAFMQAMIEFDSTLLNEKPMQSFIAQTMKAMGLDVDSFDIDVSKIADMPGYSPGDWSFKDRPVVVGTLKGSASKEAKSLVLNGHADVVPVEAPEQWTYDPWKGTVVGDRLYGRGSCDMKCGISAMIYAIKAIQMMGIKLKGDVYLQSVIEEESTGSGALACFERGYKGDGALILECTNNSFYYTAVGSLWARIKVRVNSAIEHTYRVIKILKDLENEMNQNKTAEFEAYDAPMFFNIGKIEGGVWTSNTPMECEMHVRFSNYPNTDPAEFQKMVEDYVSRHLENDEVFSNGEVIFNWYGNKNKGYLMEKGNALTDVINGHHKDLHGIDAEFKESLGCNDLRFWAHDGTVPATMYGGISGNMHGIDEYVELPSIKALTKVTAATILEWCEIENN